MGKTASTEATWALLAEGVSAARLESHRLRHLLDRWAKMVDASEDRERFYAVAGDILTAVPDRLDRLDRHLDRTNYALTRLGEDHLRDHLPLSDRYQVDEAMAGTKEPWLRGAAARLAHRWVAERQADLTPQLGWPGGRCHVVQRIEEGVRNPRVRDQLISEVEMGLTIDNREANVIYDLETDRGGGIFSKLTMTPHSQYRMDQRGITVNDVRVALMQWSKEWLAGKPFIGQPVKKQKLVEMKTNAELWQRLTQRHEPIEYNSDIGLYIVFLNDGSEARLVTAYWPGVADPKPVGEGACQV